MEISVIGSGSWGCALAQVVADNKYKVNIWGIDKDELLEIKNNHQNTKYFDSKLNENINVLDSMSEVKNSDIIVLSVPSIAIEGVCLQLNDILNKKTIIVNTAKGFHPETNDRLSNVIRNSINKDYLSSVVSLIGPSHAEEVVQRMLTIISAVSLNHEDAKKVQEVFSNDYLRVYTGTDEIGSEVGVAIKNAIALASGVLSGLGFGDNAKAGLITRGMNELIELVVASGGNKDTAIGLTGLGDLIVTCTSVHSRNFQAGYQIGKDNSVENFYKENKKTVEGVRTAKVVYNLSKQYNINLPIINEIYSVLYEDVKPKEALSKLMNRKLKKESDLLK